MIRINLLPVKAARRRETGRIQLVVAAGVIVLSLAVIVLFHGIETGKNAQMAADNQQIEDAIARLKTEIGDYDRIKAQRDELLRQKAAIEKLQRDRSGPVYLMRELSDILTRDKGPTFDKDQYEEALKKDPNSGINPAWEPKRAWIRAYEERDRQVTIQGSAKSDEDVAEFLKRLKLSAFFTDVYWKQTQPKVDDKLSVAYVDFEVTCRVNY